GGFTLRHRAVRGRSFSAVTAPGRPDDRGGNGNEENGPTNRQALQPDARSEVCHFDGSVRDFRGAIQTRLQRAQRNRPLYPSRCLYSRLPASTRSTVARLHGTAAQNRRTKTNRRWQGRSSRSNSPE